MTCFSLSMISVIARSICFVYYGYETDCGAKITLEGMVNIIPHVVMPLLPMEKGDLCTKATYMFAWNVLLSNMLSVTGGVAIFTYSRNKEQFGHCWGHGFRCLCCACLHGLVQLVDDIVVGFAQDFGKKAALFSIIPVLLIFFSTGIVYLMRPLEDDESSSEEEEDDQPPPYSWTQVMDDLKMVSPDKHEEVMRQRYPEYYHAWRVVSTGQASCFAMPRKFVVRLVRNIRDEEILKFVSNFFPQHLDYFQARAARRMAAAVEQTNVPDERGLPPYTWRQVDNAVAALPRPQQRAVVEQHYPVYFEAWDLIRGPTADPTKTTYKMVTKVTKRMDNENKTDYLQKNFPLFYEQWRNSSFK